MFFTEVTKSLDNIVNLHKLHLHLGLGRCLGGQTTATFPTVKVQIRGVRRQKMPKKSNVICESSLTVNSRRSENSSVDFCTSVLLKALKTNLFYSKKRRWSKIQKCRNAKVH